MDKLTEILENGINAKRQGKYSLALEYYEKARQLAPTDIRIFANSFRLLIGLEKYEEALRYLLIIASFNRIDRLIDKDLLDPTSMSMLLQFKSRFNSSRVLYRRGLFGSVKYEPSLITASLKTDELLNDLILRADNLTYYIGHSYIGLYPKIISTHYIPMNEFKNLNNSLLGNPSGNDLREHKSSGLFLCIGFIFAHFNFKATLKTKEDTIQYYLNKYNELNFNISDYRSFLENKAKKHEGEETFLVSFVKKKHSRSKDIKTIQGYFDSANAKLLILDYYGAIEDLSRAIEIDPMLKMAYYIRGAAWGHLGNYECALKDDNMALKIDPRYVDAYNNRGITRYELNDFLGAVEDYNIAIEINPYFAQIYCNRGNAKWQLGNYSGAIADYDKAIELQPNYEIARENRRKLLSIILSYSPLLGEKS